MTWTGWRLILTVSALFLTGLPNAQASPVLRCTENQVEFLVGGADGGSETGSRTCSARARDGRPRAQQPPDARTPARSPAPVLNDSGRREILMHELSQLIRRRDAAQVRFAKLKGSPGQLEEKTAASEEVQRYESDISALRREIERLK
ncbi:MAG: hypothetical protein LBV61_02165 [Burkholderiaceae bacterium]|jgi:hypothetical protein|nr:hypothetical protein [Burkholderiaceae bacterium]